MGIIKHPLAHDWVLVSVAFLLAAGIFLCNRHKTGTMKARLAEPPREFRQISEMASPFLLNKISCMQSFGWTWREYDALAWCESYLRCGQSVPECPGGNEHWTKVRDNSRVCESQEVKGYRVYCHHPKDTEGSDAITRNESSM